MTAFLISGITAARPELVGAPYEDADNRAVVRTTRGPELDLVGIGLPAPRNAVDKIIKGARLHP